MSNFMTKEDAIEIMKGISKKTPQGIMNGYDVVGHIEWQMYLMRDYLKLDGTPLANASNDYDELLKFAQDNSLITADTTDKSLFKYDSGTDVLTLPDYIGLCLQGGNTVEEKEAGLPNLKVDANSNVHSLGAGLVVQAEHGSHDTAPFTKMVGGSNSSIQYMSNIDNDMVYLGFDASQANSIYGNSTTVQPPAITLIPQIKYKKTTSMWEKVEIGRFVATAPSHYEREQLFTTNKTTITIYPTWINIDDIGYVLENPKTIDITNPTNWDNSSYATASNRAGKDFYIYACKSVSATEPTFVLSANSTTPTGYTANDSRKMGGFHCLCVDVGTISGHTLTGYLAGEILPNSPWDLKHRAVSENEGMSYITGAGIWMDIYLPSWNGSKLVSVYGGTVADGASSKKFHGEAFAEAFGKIGKRLVRRDEFICAMKGSNEQTNIKNSTDPNTTGGHVDTANRRMISSYGIEDGCGAYWQWAEDQYEYYLGAVWRDNHLYLDNYAWQQRSVYEASVDSQGYGSAYGLLRRARLGGYWANGAYCGSRCVGCYDFSSHVDDGVSARGVSEPRIS